MIASPLVLLSLAGQLLAMSGGPSAAPVASAADTNAMAVIDEQQVTFDATRFDSLTALSLRSFLESANEQGIPTRPLINKALEGAARRASGAKIMQTVRELAVALVQAREALGPTTPLSEIEVGADALRTPGIKTDDLIAIRATRPNGTALVPLTVLIDIVRRGVPPRSARDAVSTIAKLPSSDEMLNGLQVTVAKNALRGPGMAVDALNRYLRGAASGANPSSAPATTDRKPIRPPAS